MQNAALALFIIGLVICTAVIIIRGKGKDRSPSSYRAWPDLNDEQ